MQTPASSPHTTPTPNQDDPSRHYRDVGNTLATGSPPQPGRQGGVRNSQKRFVPGCCILCGGANLQQGPTTVKHDTGAPVQSPASSPHTTPTPNQDDPSRHYTDVGNTLATVFPPQPRHKVGWGNSQKRFAPGCCVPCGGANLQQGPTTVKHDTGASVQTPASSPHTTPTPNQDAPSRHYSDVGNTLAKVFPSTRETRWVERKSETVCTRLLHPLWWCKLAAGTHYSQT